MHAAHLVRALRSKLDLDFSGMGSDRLREAGVAVFHDYKDISVTGLSEVFLKARHIWHAYAVLKRHLIEASPALLILVDFPGFNLRIARVARQLGIPTVYFIPPQVWAWRKGRIKQIRTNVDLVLSILPFEEPLYREHGVPVCYVGHPYVCTVKPVHSKEAFYSKFAIPTGGSVITMMPGSRVNEARRHMPILLQVLDSLTRRLSSFTVLLPVADSMDKGFFDAFVRAYPHVIPIQGLPYDCLKFSDAAIIASGSATLEAAVLGVPSLVIYKVSRLSYFVARMVVQVKHISLPNIIAGKEVFPEFIQSINAEKIAETIAYMLNKGETGIQKEMERIRDSLGTVASDPYQAAGDKIIQLLERIYGPLLQTA